MSVPLFSTWTAPSRDQVTALERPASSKALHLFAALCATNIKVYRHKNAFLADASIAVGGVSSVEHGRFRSEPARLVAVKQARKFVKEVANNEKYPDRICTELCILSQNRVRTHPNIIDILGICLDEAYPFSIILEYSALGTLRNFLQKEKTSLVTKVDYIHQVALGLEALHELSICHGDVKADNALVFAEEGDWRIFSEENDLKWRIKISDFSHSIIGDRDDPTSFVECPHGTRLLHAPEIRSLNEMSSSIFDISAAFRTDVFSFGLLVWEVLKDGHGFFDASWLGPGFSSEPDVDLMETFLNELPYNGLLEKSLDFVISLKINTRIESLLMKFFTATLEDGPCAREPIEKAEEILNAAVNPHANATQSSKSDDGLSLSPSDNDLSLGQIAERATRWTTAHSITQLLEERMWASLKGLLENENFEATKVPMHVEKDILNELKLLASSEFTDDVNRGHAALCIAECYAIGFGAPWSKEEISNWLLKAAQYGNSKAISWYYRVCVANQLERESSKNTLTMEKIELCLSELSSELYFSHRIRKHAQSILNEVREALKIVTVDFPSEFVCTLGIFNNSDIDMLEPLHLAAFAGNDDLVASFLHIQPLKTTSKMGFTAIHYACMGGNISTLNIVLGQDVLALKPGFRGITALHLCVFFSEANVQSAVELLLQNGADPNSSMEASIEWEYHNITQLNSTPIIWAVRTRNRHLVSVLLPHANNSQQALKVASECFFWEIAEDIVVHIRRSGQHLNNAVALSYVKHPFFHWIAHGPNQTLALKKTLQLYKAEGILEDVDACASSRHNTNLIKLVTSVGNESSFELIEHFISLCSPEYVKQTLDDGNSALAYALIKSGNDYYCNWTKILQKLVDCYMIEELEKTQVLLAVETFLHLAAVSGSVAGVRVLLEKGVNPNKQTDGVQGVDILAIVIHSYMASSERKYMEIFKLLQNHGAHIPAYLVENGFPVGKELRLLNSSDSIYAMNSSEVSKILHSQLRTTHIARLPHVKADRKLELQVFRDMLAQNDAANHIDSTDSRRLTLVGEATQTMNLEALKLLLEAGGDASIPMATDYGPIYPLESVCTVVLLSQHIQHLGIASLHLDDAMDTALELLRWHHAKGDGLFHGITALHLAAKMLNYDKVQQLIAEHHDSSARGSWPGIDASVTPAELAICSFEHAKASRGLMEGVIEEELEKSQIWQQLAKQHRGLSRSEMKYEESRKVNDFTETLSKQCVAKDRILALLHATH